MNYLQFTSNYIVNMKDGLVKIIITIEGTSKLKS